MKEGRKGQGKWCPPCATANGLKGGPGGPVAAAGRNGASLKHRCLHCAFARVLLLMALVLAGTVCSRLVQSG
jgi:hypothetical protein